MLTLALGLNAYRRIAYACFLLTCGLSCCSLFAQSDAVSDQPPRLRPRTIPNDVWEEKHSDAMMAPLRKIPVRTVAFPKSGNKDSSLATPQVLEWLESVLRRNLPETYTDDRKWNQQKEVWDGIKWRREGLRLETERRKKMVNAGTWTRYSISLVEPEKNLFVEFQRLEILADGRIAFAITVDCSLDIFGRLSQWIRDVQIISISANADAACRLTLEGTVGFQVNPLTLPPSIALRPIIDRAHIQLTYYRVRRISQVGGDFAKTLGQGLKKVVDDKIDEMNAKLKDKINQQLTRHADKLSFSAQDWVQSHLGVGKEKQE